MTGMEYGLEFNWLGSSEALSLRLSWSTVVRVTGSGVTAKGKKLSRSDQLWSESDAELEASELSRQVISIVEWLFCRLLGAGASWEGVDW